MSQRSAAILSPVERSSEVLFGLIMVLTFTGSLSAATAGREDVCEMLAAALGCNLAWGLIDAAFYLINQFAERRRNLQLLAALQVADSDEAAAGIIGSALPAPIASFLRASDFAYLRQKLVELPSAAGHTALTAADLRGALGVFLLVFLSTFPVVLPFLFLEDAMPALRVSNGIAVLMLFAAGAALGRYSGTRPLLMGAGTMLVGLVLVSVTIALGG